ncbi:unnamed protein product [Symbiodinium necroappetens]|uniref:Fibrinogen C-terminal domain-containing protein n=1 Tax=Symbiodinium necroappetens TaxID=1628268 RepID=A0A812NM51_9DINO|nr:unnamed protein product [Symbiodinium necroappetens]
MAARVLTCLSWTAIFGARTLAMKIQSQTDETPSCKGTESPHGHTSCEPMVNNDCEGHFTKLDKGGYAQCGKSGPNCLAIKLCEKKKTVWTLALNLNPSDGHNFGYGGPWAQDTALGTEAEALDKDFKDKDVMKTKAKYLAIARHMDKKCEAVRVWELKEPEKSLLELFQDHDPGRRDASTGGPVFEYKKAGMSGSDTDPIFATKGRLMVNWWYGNNGARIALEDGSHYNGLLPQASPKNRNDDDVHGLGNEFGANTQAGQGSGSWWHDAAQKMTGDCWGTNCKMIGKDHGTGLRDGDYYGNYAIYLSSVWESGKGALAMKQLIYAGRVLNISVKTHGYRPRQSERLKDSP